MAMTNIKDRISPATALYGVIGFPVKHSLSPFLFNYLFTRLNVDAVYLAFESADTEGLIKAMRTLNIRGLSITLPHKRRACLAVDVLTESASALGAINTAVKMTDRQAKKIAGQTTTQNVSLYETKSQPVATHLAATDNRLPAMNKLPATNELSPMNELSATNKLSVMNELPATNGLASTQHSHEELRMKHNVIVGYNFDGIAAVQALERALPNWRKQNVMIVGAGGSARSIAYTIVRDATFSKKLCIAARDPEKAKILISELAANKKNPQARLTWKALDTIQSFNKEQQPTSLPPELSPELPPEYQTETDNGLHTYGIVIQTTPVGMTGMSAAPPTHSLSTHSLPTQSIVKFANKMDVSKMGASKIDISKMDASVNVGKLNIPIAVEKLAPETFVYDIIYTPLETPLIKAAKARGMPTLCGLDMFINQAVMQFEVFTQLTLSSALRADLTAKLVTELRTI
ncbi:hypothetical protein COTS27_00418 [Spirochaetota bacterium]|nr:hypothetical protein COTS27_00418 [Spirochaetota bacterium]